MDSAALVKSRQALHGVAELLLAGPQYRRSGTIRLRVTPGGFGTTAAPDLRVDGDQLVSSERFALHGRSFRQLAALVEVEPTPLDNVYTDGPHITPDTMLEVEGDAARRLCAVFEIGHRALVLFDPDGEPVLWPEHFDLALTRDEVNYGVSPGDVEHDEPYAYVGPWQPRDGQFWNAPFGAILTLDELPDATVIADFFCEGRARAASRE